VRRIRPHAVNSTSDNDNNHGALRSIIAHGEGPCLVGTNTPEPVGDPESPHTEDLFEPWVKGEYFPVLFIGQGGVPWTEAKTVLVPRTDTTQ